MTLSPLGCFAHRETRGVCYATRSLRANGRAKRWQTRGSLSWVRAKDSLIKNKRASGRPKDLADLDYLDDEGGKTV